MTATQSSIVPEPVMSVRGGVAEASDPFVHPSTFSGPLNSNSGQHHAVHTYTHTQRRFRVSTQLDVHVSFDSGVKLENLCNMCNMCNMWSIWNVQTVRADRESVKMFDFYCRHVSPCCVFITSCVQMCVGVSTDKGELYLSFPPKKQTQYILNLKQSEVERGAFQCVIPDLSQAVEGRLSALMWLRLN